MDVCRAQLLSLMEEHTAPIQAEDNASIHTEHNTSLQAEHNTNLQVDMQDNRSMSRVDCVILTLALAAAQYQQYHHGTQHDDDGGGAAADDDEKEEQEEGKKEDSDNTQQHGQSSLLSSPPSSLSLLSSCPAGIALLLALHNAAQQHQLPLLHTWLGNAVTVLTGKRQGEPQQGTHLAGDNDNDNGYRALQSAQVGYLCCILLEVYIAEHVDLLCMSCMFVHCCT